jgi:hypothetical protein
MNTKSIAEAFSGHRFAEAYDYLAEDVRWVLVGQTTIEGKAAVVEACNASASEMATLASTEFSRFVSVADDRVAAIDAVVRYVSADGGVSVVSSADVYEFDGRGRITTITSYAVELDA